VYVTRKMVAFIHNDDELAALLAHEIGHIYTHQQAIDFTRLFHEKLDVNSVGDRDNIRQLYNELLNKWRLKPDRFDAGRSAKEQIVADRLGLYALARAGYPTEIMQAFFDRLAETHGKTGSFLSDLFGVTSEDSRRLRELLRSTASMPPSCRDQSPVAAASSFPDWQQSVIAYSAAANQGTDLTDALIRKTVLNPPLQDDFSQIRFSPDGEHLLVQDGSGISVLTRDPLAVVFRITAPDGAPAGFSPDSSSVVFYTNDMRVERWGIAEKKQISVKEILERERCLQTALSSDGNTFVCLDQVGTLRVFDVNGGKIVYEKKEFAVINWFQLALFALSSHNSVPLNFVNVRFTPDAKTMIVASGSNFVAMDLATYKPVSLPSSIKRHFEYPLTFLAANRFFVSEGPDSGIYAFPSGKVEKKVQLDARSLQHAGNGEIVMFRPAGKYAVGAYDLEHQKLMVLSPKSAIDCYGDVFASESVDGKLILTHSVNGKEEVVSNLELPRTELHSLDAIAVSADMNWLAFSLVDRGAIYDLNSGERSMFLSRFRGAQFISGPAVLVDSPKKDERPRTIAKLDLAKHAGESTRTLPDDVNAFQVGGFLVIRRPAKTGGPLFQNVTIEVQDVISGQSILSQHFPGMAPAIYLTPQSYSIIFAGGVSASTAAKANAEEISTKFSWPDEKRSVYEIQVVSLITGKKVQEIHIDSGKFSFAIRDIQASADFLALADSENRVQVYSMVTGKQIGTVFGGPMHLSSSGLMAVLTERGKIALYECATLKRMKDYALPSAAIYAYLNNDGKRLLVLTADQTTYLLRTAPETTAQASAH